MYVIKDNTQLQQLYVLKFNLFIKLTFNLLSRYIIPLFQHISIN